MARLTAAISRQQWAANGTRHAAVAGAGGGGRSSVQRIAAMPQQGSRAHTPDAKPSCARCEATVVNAGAMGGGDLQARASWGEEQRPTHRVGERLPPQHPLTRAQRDGWSVEFIRVAAQRRASRQHARHGGKRKGWLQWCNMCSGGVKACRKPPRGHAHFALPRMPGKGREHVAVARGVCHTAQWVRRGHRGDITAPAPPHTQQAVKQQRNGSKPTLPSSGQGGGGRHRWNRADLGLPNLLAAHAHVATSCSYVIGALKRS